MDDLEPSLTRIRSAWMAGRSALEFCPAAWKGVIETADGDGECALVAIAGHATAALFRPSPPSPTEPRPLLPTLALPIAPVAARPLIRRALNAHKQINQPLVHLVSARGLAMHPGDWMPASNDEWVPDLYAPWLDWVRAESTSAPQSDLTIESYDLWSWAERKSELARIRRQNPEAALQIIAAKAPAEAAERRVRLIEILETNLSEADGPFLESLAKDRSDRVRVLAAAYRARLGLGTSADDLAKELAEMVEVGKVGILSRRTQLIVKALKTQPQNARRKELFSLVTFGSLAQALGIAEEKLLEAAPTGIDDGVGAFVQMVALTGSDVARRTLLERALGDKEFSLRLAAPLAVRLSDEERRSVLTQLLARDDDLFTTTLLMMGPVLGEAPTAALAPSPSYGALKAATDLAVRGDNAQRANAAASLDATINRLALLVSAPAAADLIRTLTGWGLSPADPKLDLLHLNAALIPENHP
jgi:hypothetical protein